MRSAVDASTPTCGASGIQYGSAPLKGREPKDNSATFASNMLTLTGTTDEPGEHIRVFTSPVPEPSSCELLGVGLVAVAHAASHRRRD